MEILKHMMVVGDRVLIKPLKPNEKTRTGLYLPANVIEKEQVQEGYIVKVGPGYPIPSSEMIEESWKESSPHIKYIPLQVREGDKAIFLQNNAYEVSLSGEKYFIVPQNAILMVERDESIFN